MIQDVMNQCFFFSLRPNMYVGLCEGSAMYRKWYFEIFVDLYEQSSHLPPLLRIGWANSSGFTPYPGGGHGWGCNGIGDDLFSYAFDGKSLWTGSTLSVYFVSHHRTHGP